MIVHDAAHKINSLICLQFILPLKNMVNVIYWEFYLYKICKLLEMFYLGYNSRVM